MNEKITFKEAGTYLRGQIDNGLIKDKKQELVFRKAIQALNRIQGIEYEFNYLFNKQ